MFFDTLRLSVVSIVAMASVAGAAPVELPGGAALEEVDFERHVAGLLGKLGCSAGNCHGSFQGKGGLRLSLFGHDPQADFFSLTRGAVGRRINTLQPEKSLLLLKPTAEVTHGGGKRIDRPSWQYEILRQWIARGAPRRPGSGRVRKIHVAPHEHVFDRPGDAVELKVVVEFMDGTRADVTPLADFRAKDDSIAEVSPLGQVRARRPGDTPIIASYLGQLATARVLVPFPVAQGFLYPDVPQGNYIDREIFGKLRRLRIVPAELSSDTEFLRRVTIDTIGCLPTPEEVRAFVADSRPDKRLRTIERLLVHPLHHALWATKFCDITACDVEVMDAPAEHRSRRARMWHDWFRKRIAENMPYDKIVEGVLTATSREGQEIEQWIGQEVALDQAARGGFSTPYALRATLDLFWARRMGEEFFPVEQMAELTTAAFLGVRLECAQCHKHPFDRWTQADYRALANVFSQVHFGSSPELTAKMTDLLARRRELPAERAGPPLPRLREVYVSSHRPRRLTDPETGGALAAKALGGPTIAEDTDPRLSLLRWMLQADNPFFARSFVNRVWAHYLGVGLVEPVDNFSVANPPSNEQLLAALAQDFVAHGYDLRRLERAILSSRTYQLSPTPNATNLRDRTNYSRALARPMMAEVVVDVLNSALGTVEDFAPDAPLGSHAVEVATNRVRAGHAARIFQVFGRPERTTTCDCQRPKEPSVPQTLFLMTDPELLQKMATGRLAKLVAAEEPDAAVVEEVFLATLSRPPSQAEKQDALAHLKDRERKAALVDLLWALVNTREFILNH